MVSLLVITSITTPLVKLLYNPSMSYVSSKRRTVQHTKPHSPLRILACVHTDEHVPPLLDLLEASHPTRDRPISLLLLHLTELIGRAASILRPHKRPRDPSNPSPSDRIVNAFRYLVEHQTSPGAISLHPFIAMSPYSTMHNDVCSLSLHKKACLIILPFHKHSDGAVETSKHAFQSLNRNVLDFAPCSVAILVDRDGTTATCAHTNHLLQRVAVYFLGGSDDREALALADRMAENRSIGLTVVRFRPRGGESEVEPLDEGMVDEFRARHAENEGVVYMEKVVGDGEGTVEVIRDMSQKFDLLIVGRRKGMESELTRGMSAWSECPELGILGDMLAATDFDGKVAILVVQQQERVGGGGDVGLVRSLELDGGGGGR